MEKTGVSISHELLRFDRHWVTELYRFGWLLEMDDLCATTPNGTGNSDIPNGELQWSSLYLLGSIAYHILPLPEYISHRFSL